MLGGPQALARGGPWPVFLDAGGFVAGRGLR